MTKLLYKSLLLLVLMLCSTVNIYATGTKSKTTKYKSKSTKSEQIVNVPKTKWMDYEFVDSTNDNKLDTSFTSNKNKIKVRFVYDTAKNGKIVYEVGYLYKNSNKFELDSFETYKINNPGKIAATNKTATITNTIKPKSKETKYTKEVKIPERKFKTNSIHIAYSEIPDTKTSNYLIDYINSYNANYGRHLRGLKTTQKSKISLIDKILIKHSLPIQLKYLAVIESALNTQAISKVGAAGAWQFMDFTARDYNLVVNGSIDERTNLPKSTDAAARYMKNLYKITGDWLLVIAAYNCGPGPVLNAIKRTKSKNFWVIKPYLPRETQGHVMAFLATAAIMEKLNNFSGLYNPRINKKIEIKEQDNEIEAIVTEELKRNFSPNEKENMVGLTLNGLYAKEVVLKRLQISEKDFDRWNPQFDEKMSNVKSEYKMFIPKDKLEGFIDMKNKISKESTDKISVQKLSKEEKKEEEPKNTKTNSTVTYIVQYGETLELIANRFGKSVDFLIEINSKDDSEILPGDIIRVE